MLSIALRLAAVCLVVLTLGPAASGIQPSQLPPTLPVQNLKPGIAANNLYPQARWVMIFVTPFCKNCDTMLETLRVGEDPTIGGKLTIVVSGVSTDQAKLYSARFPHLSQATWYADPARQAFKLLNLKTIPAVLGCQQNSVYWGMSSSLPESDRLRSILQTWRK